MSRSTEHHHLPKYIESLTHTSDGAALSFSLALREKYVKATPRAQGINFRKITVLLRIQDEFIFKYKYVQRFSSKNLI